MPLTLTPLYIGPLVLIFLVLTFRVILYRLSNRISLGDHGDKNLLKRIRAQANFIEYTPLALVLLLVAELQGAPAVALHIMGLMLVGGRLCHAIGFGRTPQIMVLRQLGTVLTLTMIAGAALALCVHALL